MKGENERLTFEEAKVMLPPGKEIHTFLDAGIALIGGHWSRRKILKLLRTGDVRKTGPGASGMGHGIAVWLEDHQEWLFIETQAAASEGKGEGA